MTDPLGRPPRDHGSDRHGYVELIGAPEGVRPIDEFVDSLMCPDCASNLFLTYLQTLTGRDSRGTAHVWQPRIAHDDTCPTFARIERDAP